MSRLVKISTAVFVAILIGAGLYLKTPAPAHFDRQAAIEAGEAYSPRIIRDAFGVPHIYGERDADVAFGLAYAHAEDDWATIEEVIFFSRGTLAERNGKDAAIPDYLIAALRVGRSVSEKYETDLTPETRALVEAFAAGANFWCAEKEGRCAPGAAPITPQDVVAGFASRTPFFYGLDAQLTAIFEGNVEVADAADAAREAFFNVGKDDPIGSNAMAVAPSRSADGHTRLMVNSHQPYTGPIAWYEARVKSNEGWDMIGGIFPGSPVILHGAGPNLGWAHTVNKPDLVDVYSLEVDNKKKPTKYKFDGGWRDFEVDKVTFRVKLFGPFSLPVKRRALHSVHGPVFLTDKGAFAVSYGGAGDIRTVEQWYKMNKAQDFASWRDAMDMSAIPSFNVVYGDREGNIAYYYNASIPERNPAYDPAKTLPGDKPDALWGGVRPFSAVPSVVNPASGYVVNANNTPFKSSADADNPDPADFPKHFGVDQKTTNRGFRIQSLYGGDPSITEEEFLRYKMDNRYAENSRVMELVRNLVNGDVAADPDMNEAIELLRGWDGAVTQDNRAAALATLTAQKARGYLLNDEDVDTPDYDEAFRSVAAALKKDFGRIDPKWSEVVRLKRGEIDLGIDGGPDTLRAVYPDGVAGDGVLSAAGGDTYILYADWPKIYDTEEGAYPEILTIHQFGAATLDEASPHYADQAEMFVRGEWKTPPMTLEALLAEATADYSPGQNIKQRSN